MNKRVFISYPSGSGEFAELLVNFLKAQDIQAIWIDKDEISAGENINHRLKNGVNESACCIFLLNSHSLVSPWCMAEVGSFWGAGKKIIIYNIEPRCELPSYLTGIKVANTLSDIIDACKSVEAPLLHIDSAFHDTFHKNGLTSAFRVPIDNPARDKRIKEVIRDECSLDGEAGFRLIASSGFNYLSSNGQSWKAGLGDAILERKARFSVILESPFSLFAKTRALANKVKYHHWQEKISIHEMLELSKLDNVSISVTDVPVNCSLFFTSKTVFYDPYLWAKPKSSRKTENNFWVFEFNKIDELEHDCYNLLLKHYEFLESTSIALEEFLGENLEKYIELTRVFQEEMEASKKTEQII